MRAVHVIGDVHGEFEKLRMLLREADLIDRADRWSGGRSELWLMGDLVDHGCQGIDVVNLVMTLQREARSAGGQVEVLLGNHDILLLAARRFGDQVAPGQHLTFKEIWQDSGGVPSDLKRLELHHVFWLSGLPAMVRIGDNLVVHADSHLYLRYGRSIEVVNRSLARLLETDDAAAWMQLLEAFGEHRVFAKSDTGAARAEAFLDVYGGNRIVHGHTPITKLTGQPPEAVREPLIYAREYCIDLDAGMYLGGTGFVYRLPDVS